MALQPHIQVMSITNVNRMQLHAAMGIWVYGHVDYWHDKVDGHLLEPDPLANPWSYCVPTLQGPRR